MKRLRLIALKADEERILKALQGTETVQIIPHTETAFAEVAAFEEKIKNIRETHDYIKGFGKKPLLAATPECTVKEVDEALTEADALCGHIGELQHELSALSARIEKRQSRIELLTPFKDMETPIERIAPTKNTRIIAVVTDAPGEKAIEEASAEKGFACEFYGTGGAVRAAILACMKDDDCLNDALSGLNAAEFRFPDATGTVKENIEKETSYIKEEKERIERINEELTELSEKRLSLEKAHDAATIDRDLEQGRSGLYTTEYAFVLDGWIKEDDEQTVRDAVASVTDAYELTVSEPEKDEVPPTALKNGRLATPFESLTDLYSRPAYAGIDPTGVMTPFYLIFFGMMLCDTGYGLVLFIGGLLYSKLLKPRNNMAKLAKVIMWCGLSTAAAGLAFGTFFGISWPDIFGAGTIFPLIDPLKNIMTMIILCCAMGLFHMMFGIGVKIFMCVRDGDYMAAIFDHFSWMLLVLGLVALLASGYVSVSWLPLAAKIMAITGAAMILLFAGRTKKNIIKRVGGGLGALYNVTSYLGDTLSYVRILALGLVGGAMGMVFNMIGAMIYNGLAVMGVVGAVIGVLLAGILLIVLHAFSLFINTLGSYVHCARLQFVEFFGKFYEANGEIFRPLGYNSKYVRINKKTTFKEEV